MVINGYLIWIIKSNLKLESSNMAICIRYKIANTVLYYFPWGGGTETIRIKMINKKE